MNPIRMEVIKEVAGSFAKPLATPCPLCYNPGWGIVDMLKVRVRDVWIRGSETEIVKSESFRMPQMPPLRKPSKAGWINPCYTQYCGGAIHN